MLEVRDLDVHYGRIAAVRGLSVRVAKGEVVGLIGPNGAGKTTTLAAVAGIIKPSAGDVRFEDRSITGEAPERIVRRGIALVPEGRQIFGTLTVRENLSLGLMNRRGRDRNANELGRVYELFPVLQTYLSVPAAKLSGGEQQQLAIARALLLNPQLLMLDEPSLGLAPRMVDLVFDVLRELRADGVTIILVEQVARRTCEFADRTYVLRRGQVVLEGTRAELQRNNLTEAYLGF